MSMGIASQDESLSRAGHDNSTQIRCARDFALWVINEFTKPHHYTQNRIIVSVIRMFSAGRREAAIALMDHLLEYDDEHCTPAFDWPDPLHLIPDAMQIEDSVTGGWKATHWAFDKYTECVFPVMVEDGYVYPYDAPAEPERLCRYSLGENDPDTWFADVWQWLAEKAHGKHAIPESARAKTAQEHKS